MRRRDLHRSGGALLLVCALAAGCGGSSRLSASQYRDRLATIAQQADKAQANVEKALSAASVTEIQTRLTSFAAAEQGLGNEVAALKSPENAEAANAELARGEHDTAREVRSALRQLATMKSVKAAVSFLNTSLGGTNGGREVDQALAELKKAGYTKGS
jgi:multidrug efflux pump subunit AcrA (membrane-fusion protein)